jgi:group I intron endonuclease
VHVYQITNLENDKIYIGQHAKSNLQAYLKSRIAEAFRKNSSSRLYRAIRKYGRNAFVIQSLVNPIDKQQMDEMEKFFIRTLDTRNPEIGYNITEGGEGCWGYKPTTEAIAKGIATRKTNGTYVAWNKGKTDIYSDDTLRKMGKGSKGKPSPFKGIPTGRPSPMKGKTGIYSEETLRKMRDGAKNRPPDSAETRRKKGLAAIRINTGRKHSAESRNHMSAAQKGKTRAEESKTKHAATNMRLQTPTMSSSKYKGVSWRPTRGKYRARVKVRGREICLGHFTLEIDAAKAYDAFVSEHFPYAYTNLPQELGESCQQTL